MNRSTIEARVYEIAERVKAGQPVEDDFVELKRDFEPAKDVARKIAGHANVAHGEPVLWIFGIDQKGQKIVGLADVPDIADWGQQLVSRFDDGVAPDMALTVAPLVDGLTILAILFLTDRAPYVVKNQQGGQITSDVPYRVGTRTDSARRSQILRMLGPIERVPEIELFSAYAEANAISSEELVWHLNATVYITPPTRERVVIPAHKCFATLETGGVLVERLARMSAPVSFGHEAVEFDKASFIINGPGQIMLVAGGNGLHPRILPQRMRARIEMLAIGAARPAIVTADLFFRQPVNSAAGTWYTAGSEPILKYENV